MLADLLVVVGFAALAVAALLLAGVAIMLVVLGVELVVAGVALDGVHIRVSFSRDEKERRGLRRAA